ncbi:MAG: sigma-B regulation protein RsbU (phosphoserine phosphatase) [Phycisphaerales bacterium]|jgi:sigma-B regulation protein RsbU (phosphoserine phosphatase)
MPADPPSKPTTLRLIPVAGPALPDNRDEITLAWPGPHTIGRSLSADFQLPDPAISRQHARLETSIQDPPAWTLTDLGSTHGTRLNGEPLTPRTPVPLHPGDQLTLGPFLLRIGGTTSPLAQPLSTLSIELNANSTDRVEHVPARELGPPAQQRLDLIIECAAQMNSAADLWALAPIAVQTALLGSGYARAALVRPPAADGSVEIIAHRSTTNQSADSLSLSQSLIAQAAQGHFVRLTADQPIPDSFGQSIASLGIHSALCAPITVGDRVDALLYLDARGSEASLPRDAASFVQVVARIAGLAIASLDRKRLELDRVQIRAELAAALEAQRMIMPPKSGVIGPIEYGLETIPGRHVAGDLFDIIPMGEDPENPTPTDPVACLLGDVSGKGLAAAMTMASVQTHLRAALRYHQGDPAAAAREVNRALFPRLSHGRFVTLWLGVIDPQQHTITYVDAGHGYALTKAPGEPAVPIDSRGLYPLGISPDAPYLNETCPLRPGSRLLLFSDGVIEQPNTNREQFGIARTLAALSATESPADDIAELRAAVMRHAGHSELADDFTLASLRLVP